MFFRRGVSKRKRIRDTLILLTGLLLIGFGILNQFAPVIDISAYQQDILTRISHTLQRKFQLDGKLFIKLSLKPTLVTQNLTIDNPDWSKVPHMLQARQVEFGIDLVDLLLGRITIDRLILQQASIHLEQTPAGQNNWTFGQDTKAQKNGTKASPLRLDYAVLDNVVIDFHMPQRHQKFSIGHARLHRSLRGRYRLDLDSQLGSQKFTLQASSNRWLDLQDFRPLKIKLETGLGDNRLLAEVEVQQFLPRLQASITASSSNLDVNNILEQLPSGEKKKSGTTLLPSITSWLNKTDSLSLQLDIARLRYRHYAISQLSVEQHLLQDSYAKNDKFTIKARLQAETIINLNDKQQVVPAATQAASHGRLSLALQGQGNTAEQLVSNTRFKLDVKDVSGEFGHPYYVKQLKVITGSDQMLQINGEIVYRDTAINLNGQTGKDFIGQLHQQGQANLEMMLATGRSRVKLNTTAREIFKPVRKVHLRLKGDHLAQWSGLFDKRLPLLERYKLESRFDIRADGIKSRLFVLQTRASKLQGRFYYHYGKPATLNILLENSRLVLTDLNRTPKQKTVKIVTSNKLQHSSDDGQKEVTKPQVNMRVIPATDLMSLLAPTIDVNLEVKSSHVVFSRFTVKNMDLKTRWQDKVLAVQIPRGKISEGDLNADIYLTVVDNEAAGKIEIHVKQLDYGKLMQDLKFGDKMKGKADLNIHLVGFGRDLREFLNHSDGIAEFIGEQGILASKYLKLWGEDIAQYIFPFNWFESEQTRLNCVVGRFDLTDGRLSSDSLLLDTAGMTIAGTGAIDLKSEELAFELMPDPKKITLISLATPVKIRGTLARPRLEPHTLGTTWTIGSLLVGLANPAVLIARFGKLGSLGENPCLAAIGKKEGEEQETSILKLFKDAVKFIQRPLDKMPDVE